ncbi:hypothetical protein BSL78_17596, partial [Apostichopus japonicus]
MAASLKGLKKELKRLLKTHYQEQYSAIRPLPWRKDKLYSIEEIHINGGIELLIVEDNINKKIRWEALESYYGIYRDPRLKKSRRRILEGHAGYGKSLLTLKLAFDWCTGVKDSPLFNVELLILLKFSHLRSSSSIPEAIKRFILPIDSPITSEQIEYVIGNCKSVSVLLDGYDRSLFLDTFLGNDVTGIVQNDVLKQFDVTLTSKYLPDDPTLSTQRIRLTGFDEDARDQYIRNVAVRENPVTAGRIKQLLEDNPILSDLCRAPSLFAMVAHASEGELDLQNYRTVTGLVRGLVSCFIRQMGKTIDANNERGFHLTDAETRKLGEIAMEGVGYNKPTLWKIDEFIKRVGEQLCKGCIQVGILEMEDDDMVKFYHPVFCEWFAAYYVSELTSRDDIKLYPPYEMDGLDESEKNRESEILENADPENVLFFYNFASGMNSIAARNLHDYLNRIQGCDRLAALCLLEHEEQLEEGSKAIRNVCQKEVDVSWFHKETRQRSTINLLESASKKNIPISSIVCHESLRCINDAADKMIFKSGLAMNYLTTLQEIWFEQREKEYTEDEFHAILKFAAKCDQLVTVKFVHSLLPQFVNAGEAQAILLARNCEVFFHTLGVWYFLDLSTGSWQFRIGRHFLSNEDFENAAEMYRIFYHL